MLTFRTAGFFWGRESELLELKGFFTCFFGAGSSLEELLDRFFAAGFFTTGFGSSEELLLALLFLPPFGGAFLPESELLLSNLAAGLLPCLALL